MCITTFFVYDEPMIILMLDEVLKEKGKTAYQVAKSTGLHQSVVSKLRRNEAKMIALDVLNRLCDELDCEPSDLIVRLSSKAPVPRDTKKPASKPKTLKKAMLSSGEMNVGDVRERLKAVIGKKLSRERISNYIAGGELGTTQPGGKRTPHIISEAQYLDFEAWYKANILKGKI